MIGLIPNSFLTRSAVAGGTMIPSRTVFEAARIAVDPTRDRGYNVVSGLVAEAGLRAVTTLGPSALRFISEVRQARGRPLSETFSALLNRSQRPVLAPPARLNPDTDPILSRYPKAFRTHPFVLEVAGLLESNKAEEAYHYLRNNWTRCPSFLTPVIDDLLGEIGARAFHNGEGVRMIEAFQEQRSRSSFADQFPVEHFHSCNARGIAKYDHDTFGKDPLSLVGGGLQPSETLLWKMIGRLPQGAHLADWGSGAGLFGHEVKALRPDLKITSVDLYSPEAILGTHLNPPATPETLRSEMTFLTGDASEVSLAREDRADFLLSVFLMSWVPDPLKFFAHMYNQVKPGGMMLATIHMETYDIDRPFGERMIGRALAEDLKAQGVAVELATDDRTIAVRRPDERELSVAASLQGSSYEEIAHALGFISLYYNFYRRAASGPRWVALR